MSNAFDDDIDRLVGDLGRTIEIALTDSPQVAAAIERIKAAGYEIAVSVDTTIAYHRPFTAGAATAAVPQAHRRGREPAPLKMTPLDKKFLRSLKISVEDD